MSDRSTDDKDEHEANTPATPDTTESGPASLRDDERVENDEES